MKTIKTILFFLFVYTLSCYAQENLLLQDIQKAKDAGEGFIPVSTFTTVTIGAKHSTKIQEQFIKPGEVSILRYNKSTAKNLSKAITMPVPFKGKELQLELQEITLEYTLRTSSGHVGNPDKTIKHYRGVVKGDPNSIVALTFGEDEVMGIIATDEGNLNLALDRQLGEHILYNDQNMKQKPTFECGTIDDHHSLEHYRSEILLGPSKSTTDITTKVVRFYMETEFDIFQARGSVAAVETFITGIYNQVAILYQNENIQTSLSELFVWNTIDPYTTSNIEDLLTQFQNIRTSFNGDLGHLLTFRDVGGGLAASFNGLCNNNDSAKLAVSMLQNNFQNVPNYSWSVQVVTHEFGHLLGSRHTHACVWNGNNTAIDGCAGGTEGGCAVPGIPSNGGTIMSYCHWQSVGINFNLGFGTQPGNVIRNNVANAGCLISTSGPEVICPFGTYELNFGRATSWNVTPSTFSITASDSTSATVKASALASGQTGILTAMVNGVAITREIQACEVIVSGGLEVICSEPHTFYLGSGYTAVPNLWYVEPHTLFAIESSTATSVTVKALSYNGQSGTLRATLTNGEYTTRNISACNIEINGANEVCYPGSSFSLTSTPSGTITWTVTGPFSFSSNSNVTTTTGNSPTVYRRGTGSGGGTLTAKSGNITMASKSISPCAAPTISGPNSICSGSSVTFTVSNAPSGFTWNKSSNISLSGTGTSITASATGASGHDGWISIRYNGEELVRESNIAVSGPYVSGQFSDGVSGWQSLYTVNFVEGDYITAKVDYPGADYYSWSKLSGNVSWGDSDNMLSLYLPTPYNGGYASASFRVTIYRSGCPGAVSADYHFEKSQWRGASSYSIYPNPASSVLRFEMDKTKAQTNSNLSRTANANCEVQLITMQTGTLVFKQTVPNFTDSFDINLSTVSDGMYLLRMLQNGEVVHLQTIMVQKNARN